MDEATFTELATRLRRELHVHCYRMLGSFDEAEEVVQEVLLRAWRGRHDFAARSSARVWLYRIATNACLDQIRRRARSTPPSGRSAELPEVAWLQPYPDLLLDEVATAADPGEIAVERETIELVFVAALQLLPARQRAVLILRDLLDWPVDKIAPVVAASVTAVNSALQRARATVREKLPHRSEWKRPAGLTDDEKQLLRRYVAAHERGDIDTVVSLLHADLQVWMPPDPRICRTRAAYVEFAFSAPPPGRWRVRLTSANRQPAAAFYLRRGQDTSFHPVAVQVLRLESGLITQITAFRQPNLFPVFGQPAAIAGALESDW
ncbi:MAG: RNA polymerase subunit sigma-70 [Hamadaea sp.]|uniref:RNA polymerase subunit sigma-70 n=1 Tax=Hamadaea sp. TaxID=2024425 RepID=UPI001832675B|nr:RNA polymerase subunit sigma-70 [Hamadaea sp.]NUR72356.1 RNA polymerase subunit sigma-70 [Hamadaea sp.]NUT20257.1 RNA polymerase subunit sigma-70 [Hamadaea sp.]